MIPASVERNIGSPRSRSLWDLTGGPIRQFLHHVSGECAGAEVPGRSDRDNPLPWPSPGAVDVIGVALLNDDRIVHVLDIAGELQYFRGLDGSRLRCGPDRASQ